MKILNITASLLGLLLLVGCDKNESATTTTPPMDTNAPVPAMTNAPAPGMTNATPPGMTNMPAQ